MIDSILLVVLLIGSYLLGTIHFAKIISKRRKDDITTHGSGNPGTMNMVRTHGVILGSLTLILDALKGAVPVLVAGLIFKNAPGQWAAYAMHLSGFMAVLGHIFPVFTKFKGGKGVATSVGFFTVINPLFSLVAFVVGLIAFLVAKIGSLASLTYVTIFLILQVAFNFEMSYLWQAIIILTTVTLVVFSHKSNVKKLVKNQETKIDLVKVLEKDKELIKEQKEKLKKK